VSVAVNRAMDRASGTSDSVVVGLNVLLGCSLLCGGLTHALSDGQQGVSARAPGLVIY
jgi:hypothetical protein